MMFMKLTIMMLCVLLGVAYMTLLERKLLSYVQNRKGPNKVSFMGLLQPLADAAKLFLKERLVPYNSNRIFFSALPCVGLIVSLALWHVMPSSHDSSLTSLTGMVFLCLSALNVYVVFGAGWASNSTYAFLGGLRAGAQTISYEISLVFLFFFVLLMLSTLNFTTIMSKYSLFFLFFPLAAVWFVTCLAETNRAPFDFAEGESELVSGFNIEYGGGLFAFLFLAEYTSIMFLSALTVVCFLPSSLVSSFCFWTLILIILFLLVRGVYPRYRYDLLMMLCWKTFLPFSLSLLSLSVIVFLL